MPCSPRSTRPPAPIVVATPCLLSGGAKNETRLSRVAGRIVRVRRLCGGLYGGVRGLGTARAGAFGRGRLAAALVAPRRAGDRLRLQRDGDRALDPPDPQAVWRERRPRNTCFRRRLLGRTGR